MNFSVLTNSARVLLDDPNPSNGLDSGGSGHLGLPFPLLFYPLEVPCRFARLVRHLVRLPPGRLRRLPLRVGLLGKVLDDRGRGGC